MTRGLQQYGGPKSTDRVITSVGLILEKARGLRDHIWDHHTCEASSFMSRNKQRQAPAVSSDHGELSEEPTASKSLQYVLWEQEANCAPTQ